MEMNRAGRGLWSPEACQASKTPGKRERRSPQIMWSSGRGRMIRETLEAAIGDVNNNKSNVGGLSSRQASLSPTHELLYGPGGRRSGATSPSTPTSGRSRTPGRDCPSAERGEDISPSRCRFCHRPTQTVCCRTCGHTFKGRVRSKCRQHPALIHLMDYEACPSCKAYQLVEFHEYHEPHTPPGSPDVNPAAGVRAENWD